MCGITGYVRVHGSRVPSRETLIAMTGALSHRGPDGRGYYWDENAGLGHARLSIIDLSGGSQPIRNEDGDLLIVFNGEIFNYVELRSELVRRGHRFATSTDTEVIIHLFEEEGADCVERLNGQFAFAIWDARKARLFAARDRFGILPLHYAYRDGIFVFASEIRSIFLSGVVARRIDPVALEQIFTLWSPLPGRTAFESVMEIPPGTWLTVADGELKTKKYWDFPAPAWREEPGRSLPELSEELAELLADAVRIRLRADVPVGSYLSGGLDSSGITALVKRKFDNRLRTFGVCFGSAEFDERKSQRRVVAFLETDHTDIVVEDEEIGSGFPDVVVHSEKPLLRTAPVPLFLLARKVRESGFKVVLTGEGADELFGGYDIFKEALIRRFWARYPESRMRPLLLLKLYPDVFGGTKGFPNLKGFFGVGLDKADDPLFSHMMRWNNTARIKTFFSKDMRYALRGYDVLDEVRSGLPPGFAGWDALSKAQYLENTIFLGNYLLSSQGDRMAMAHGVELRPPFLDHRIAEFMARVPPHMKIRGLREKHLLRKTLEPLLPAEISQRPKFPYRAPVVRSLLSAGGRSPIYRDLLSESSIKKAGIFDPKSVGLLVRKLERSPRHGEVDAMALAGIFSTQVLDPGLTCESAPA